MHRALRASVLVLLALLLQFPAAADSSTAGVGGTVVDPSGNPVAGARVIVEYLDEVAPNEVRSDEAGGFHVRGIVPQKRFYVRGEHDDLIFRSACFTMHSDSDGIEFTVELREPTRIVGRVRGAANEPVPDTDVVLEFAGDELEVVKTDAQGRFSFENLYPYESSYAVRAANTMDYVHFDSGKPEGSIDLIVDPERRFTITGHVFDPEGNPVGLAHVAAHPQPGVGPMCGFGLPAANTDRHGFYRILGVWAGKYDIHVLHRDWSEQTLVGVEAGGENVDLVLNKESPEIRAWFSLLPTRSTLASWDDLEVKIFSWRRPEGNEHYEIELRRSVANTLLAKFPYAPKQPRHRAFPDGSLWAEDGWPTTEATARSIGNTPRGEYSIVLTEDGTRISNVASVILADDPYRTAEPPLQIHSIEPFPGRALPLLAIQAVGPDPLDPEFTNFAVRSAEMYVDGMRQPRGVSLVGHEEPLQPGEAYSFIISLDEIRPEIGPGTHEIYVRVLEYESNHLTFQQPF